MNKYSATTPLQKTLNPMPEQDLIFNILTFDFPKQPQTFYFSTESSGSCTRLHKTNFPNNIEDLFPGITSDGTDFIFTTFNYPKEGFLPLEIDFQSDNTNLIKKFYNREINHYFKKVKNQIVRTNFINETEIWLYAQEESTGQFFVFDKYTLKVQLCTVSNFPELLISYEGKSKVFKKSAAEMALDVSTSLFNWVIKERKLFRYERLAKSTEPEFEKAYPVLNNDLRDELGLEPPALGPKENRYSKYLSFINTFYENFLNTEEFKSYIPLHDSGFLQVPESLIRFTDPKSNTLAFGDSNPHWTPSEGIKKYKPYKNSPYNNIHLFFIVHIDDIEVRSALKTYLTKELGWFKGLQQYVNLLVHPQEDMDIIFTNRENPLPEIENSLSSNHHKRKSNIKYIAVYLSLYGKFERDTRKRKIYYHVKEALLKRNITSQTIEASKVLPAGNSFAFSLTNIAVAMLAKLGGIPWRLNVPEKNDLIVGVGAFRHKTDNTQYIGSAFSFNNEGKFKRFEYFMKHETDLLAGSIASAIRSYVLDYNENPTRLIIHFYKTLSEKELAPIQKALEGLALPNPIPIFIISINKTESEDIIAFDTAFEHLMPTSGTIIKVNGNKFLLFNNTR